jgi:transketolase
VRLGRQDAKVLHKEDVKFALGKMIRLREGRDVTLIATGHMVEQALLAADKLARSGVQCRVLDCHTIKPIDREEIILAARETRGIVTAEDHNIIGGLGSAVCEVVSESHPTRVLRMGLKDRFASSARDYRKLLSHFQIDSAEIVRLAREIVGEM